MNEQILRMSFDQLSQCCDNYVGFRRYYELVKMTHAMQKRLIGQLEIIALKHRAKAERITRLMETQPASEK